MCCQFKIETVVVVRNIKLLAEKKESRPENNDTSKYLGYWGSIH